MEMLIVVAIIAILIAIAIPTFTKVLEKSREASDLANIRSAYAIVMTAVIDQDTAKYEQTVDLVQKKENWVTDSAQSSLERLGNVEGIPTPNGTCKVTWSDADQKVTFYFDGEGSGEPDTPSGYIKGDSRKAVMTGLADFFKDLYNSEDWSKVSNMFPLNNYPNYVDTLDGVDYQIKESWVNNLAGKTAYWEDGQAHKWSEVLGKYGISEDQLNTGSQGIVYFDTQTNAPIAVSYNLEGDNGAYRYVYLDDGTTVEFSKRSALPGKSAIAYNKQYAVEHGTVVSDGK